MYVYIFTYVVISITTSKNSDDNRIYHTMLPTKTTAAQSEGALS